MARRLAQQIALIAAGAALLGAGPAAADLKQVDGKVCYEVIVIGTITAYGEFASYDELFGPASEDTISIGGRQEMTVRVDEILGDGRLSPSITVRTLMGSAYRLPAPMLFYLQREERGSYWAAAWRRIGSDSVGGVDTSKNSPPRCPA